MIAALDCVDYATMFGEDDPSALIRALRPDVVCKGGDYRAANIPELAAVESIGGRFVWLRQVPGVRSSSLIARARR